MRQRGNRTVPLVAMAVAGLATTATGAHAEENFQLSTITFTVAKHDRPNAVVGTGTTDGHVRSFEFEHFGVTDWGTFYIDLESNQGKGVGSIAAYGDKGSALDMFAAVVPRLSHARLTGRCFTLGPISDVSPFMRVAESSYYHYQAIGFGVTLSFSVPGFIVFDSGLLTHNTTWDLDPAFNRETGHNHALDKHKWLWRTYAISKPLDFHGQRFNFNLQSYVNTSGNGSANRHGTEMLVITDYLWNIRGNSDYQIGIRDSYSSNKNSASIGLTDNSYRANVPYLMFKYTL